MENEVMKNEVVNVAEVVRPEVLAEARKKAGSGAAARLSKALEDATEAKAKAEELANVATEKRKEAEAKKAEAEGGDVVAVAAYRDAFDEVKKADTKAAEAEAVAADAEAVAEAAAAFNVGLNTGRDFYTVIMEETPEDVEAREAVGRYVVAKGKAKKAAEELEAVERDKTATAEDVKKAKAAKKAANAEKRDAAKKAAEKTEAAKEREKADMEAGLYTAFTFSGGYTTTADGLQKNAGSREAWARRPLALRSAAYTYASEVVAEAEKLEGVALKSYTFYNFSEDGTGVLLDYAGTAYAHRAAKTTAFEVGTGRVWDMYRSAARGDIFDYYFSALRMDVITSLFEGTKPEATAEAAAEAAKEAERVAALPYHEAAKEKKTAAAWKEEVEYNEAAAKVYDAFRRGVLPLAYVLAERRAYDAAQRHFSEWGSIHTTRGLQAVSLEALAERMERSEDEREADAHLLREEADALAGELKKAEAKAKAEAEAVAEELAEETPEAEEAEAATEDGDAWITYPDLYAVPTSYYTKAAEEAAELADEADEGDGRKAEKVYTVEEAAEELAAKAGHDADAEWKKRRAGIVAEAMKAAELSAQEKRVLLLLHRGYSWAEAAEKIGVSKGTIETYRGRIAAKLAAAIASTTGADSVEYYGLKMVAEDVAAKEAKREEVNTAADELRAATKERRKEADALAGELKKAEAKAKAEAEAVAEELAEAKAEAKEARRKAEEAKAEAWAAIMDAEAWAAEVEAEAAKAEELADAAEEVEEGTGEGVLLYNIAKAEAAKTEAEAEATKAEEAAGTKAAAVVAGSAGRYEKTPLYAAIMDGRKSSADAAKKKAAEADDDATKARADARRAAEAYDAGKAAFSSSVKENTKAAAEAAENAYFYAVKATKEARRKAEELEAKAAELEAKAEELEAKAAELEAVELEAKAAATDVFFAEKVGAKYTTFLATKEARRKAEAKAEEKAKAAEVVAGIVAEVVAAQSEARRKVAVYIAEGRGITEAAAALKKSKGTVGTLAKRIMEDVKTAAAKAAKAGKITTEDAAVLAGMTFSEVVKKYTA